MNSENQSSGKGYSGVITNAGLHDMIQLICIGRNTCRMQVTSGTRKGTIYFKEGDIVNAEERNIKGEQALFNILSWELGTFECDETRSQEETIRESWDFLLMESVRRIDSLKSE